MTRGIRQGVSAFDSNSMFSSSHRVKIQDDSSEDEADYDYPPISQKKYFAQGRPSILPRRRRCSIDSELFELTDKLTGESVDFTLYNETDLPFLDPKNS